MNSLAQKYRDVLERRDSQIGLIKVLVTIVALAFLVGTFTSLDPAFKYLFIFIFIFSFFFANLFHTRFRERVLRWKAFVKSLDLKEARKDKNLNLLWNAKVPWHEKIIKNLPKAHPYATDLDIPDGLFLLLNTCSTREGSEKLWNLLLTAGIDTSCDGRDKRSSAAKSASSKVLREMDILRLREDFISEEIATDTLAHDIEIQNFKPRSLWFPILNLIAWCVLLLPPIFEFFSTGDSTVLIRGMTYYLVFPLIGIGYYKETTALSQQIMRKVRTIKQVFRFTNKESYKSISNLDFWLRLLEIRRNPVAWLVLHLVVPFDALVCVILEKKLLFIKNHLEGWWQEATEFDVSCAVARLSREDLGCRYFATSSSATLVCEGLGHPLIPFAKRINNNFSLQEEVVLLTGSNMAGKSTFLRTLGVNMVLFNMGAPVCAHTFETRPHKVLCAIRVDDSLEDGTSYFYAEVKRLKFVLDSLSNKSELQLFLIDEIFRGTNNRERFLGSWHLIKALEATQQKGVVSTHDLALTELAHKEMKLVNMHFKEHIENDVLEFDYKIQPGPCPTTNALYIMKHAGLPIPDNVT